MKFQLLKGKKDSGSSISQKDDWKGETLRIVRSPVAIRIYIGLVLLVGIRLGLNWFLHRGQKAVVPSVEVVSAEPRTLDSGFELPGNIEAIEQSSLYAHVSGYLKKIYVDEGDTVKKGQLLAEIDAPDIVQEYHRAKADHDLKDVTRKRYKDLLAEKVVSQQEFDTIEAEAAESQARFDNASANLSYTRITAPFAGSIARRFKYPGDLITASKGGEETPLFMLVNEQKLRVSINVPQIETSRIKLGQTVDIRVDALAGKTFGGQVSRLDDLLNEATKTQRVLIDLDNKDGKLHAGMFASVSLHVEHKEKALSLPKEAVHERSNGSRFVNLVRAGQLRVVPVTVGAQDDKFIEVVSGVSMDDKVIVSGADSLVDGATVEIVSSKASGK